MSRTPQDCLVLVSFVCGLSLVCGVSLLGCHGRSEFAADTQHDMDHQHKHIHGEGHDHEHDHESFSGAHDHEHSHGHRHGEALYGGQVVAIGHSHHKDREDHFHAEIMPIESDVFTMHVLTEEGGESKPYPIDDKEILVYVNAPGAAAAAAREMSLRPASEAGDCSKFQGEVPESLRGKSIEGVIPKILLGGERLTFSFEVKQPQPTIEADESADE